MERCVSILGRLVRTHHLYYTQKVTEELQYTEICVFLDDFVTEAFEAVPLNFFIFRLSI